MAFMEQVIAMSLKEHAKFLNLLDYNSQKIITCHLGNGASITAIKDGKSLGYFNGSYTC
jgi:acetate kinase